MQVPPEKIVQLPSEIKYTKKASLPDGTTCLSAVTSPANGSVFQDSSLVMFQLLSKGYLVPSSMYLRYKTTLNNGATQYTAAPASMRGSFPSFSPFLRMETIIGSSTVESISNYGQMCQMLLSTKIDYGAKLGLSAALGVGNTALSQALTFNTMNGHTAAATGATNAAGESWFNCIPINNVLANAESLIPLGMMPAVTIQFYLDTIANICVGGATAPASFSLSNMELCYDVITFNEEVDQIVQGMTDSEGKIVIKSQSYLSSGQTSAAVTQGSQEYIYSARLASIKSLFLIQSGTWTDSVNKNFDSFDITSSAGSYQFQIGGVGYPSRPLNTATNRAAILGELGQASGSSAQDISKYKFSISSIEFSPTLCNNGGVTTLVQPSKFFVGVNTERLSTNSALLTGVSSQLSPISVRIDISNATTYASTLNLVCNFDAIISIDIINRQCSVLI
jgi:hypothetical protein